MKKFVMAAICGTVAGAVISTQVAPLLAQGAEKPASVYEQLDLFGDVFERIRAGYVEKVDDKKLIEAAINGMLTSLDPHSSYMPPDDYDNMKVQTRGSFGGLGIEVTQEDGAIKVVSPMDGTPADQAGIQSGDFITQVNGESLMGLSLDQAVDKMRGPVGSEITVTIVRQGQQEPFDVTMTRDTIKMTAVRGRVEGNTVVLRITTFNDQTFPNLKENLAKAVQDAGGMDKVNGIVIDLRNNPGGLLNQAIEVSDAFLDKGEIVSTRGRNPEDSERWNATPGDLAEGKPMVVLINGGSASASEIVTGALQDHHRAVVVGTKSFGKGSVQTVIPIKGEGAMRLTTARYYTPSGRSIQALGIAPDIVVQQPDPVPANEEDQDKAAAQTRSEADLRGVLSNDSMTEEEKQQYKADQEKAEAAAKLRQDDYQLAYAIDILKGMVVLGQDVPTNTAAVPVPEQKSAN
ncbi:S41 family peptidase [Paenirhodobacter populi]|uniref:S41 family peptidase n=1 Tax=Paenirhodobacter populi TaxID=2306993 RepID=A0A443JBD1_9RHOB|nr:S41 family peptidase [Sinirhodobacter populi]RWR07016.1 S41 family peptidase [Sinirhodobacter populi]RWR11275.1 S41 family peptidase [Sinirhodobacter populi]RWR17802.1 S41 family peptidase [Sinirhodobacter populi]RWR32915.1 S41 family peptidase [Sinirhodobacter populi]